MNRFRLPLVTFLCLTGNSITAEPQTRPSADATRQRIDIVYGPKTTVLSEPRRADGTIDHIQALNGKHSRRVIPANNGFVHLAGIIPDRDWSPDLRRKTFEKLGVPAPGGDAPRFINFHEFVRASIPDDGKQNEILEHIMSTPWTTKQHPEAAAWIEANQAVFDAVERACGSRKYWEPFVSKKEDDVVPDVLLPQLGFSRNVARLIAARALQKIGEQDIQGATDDLILLLRFSRLSASSPTLISHLVGTSISRMG